MGSPACMAHRDCGKTPKTQRSKKSDPQDRQERPSPAHTADTLIA